MKAIEAACACGVTRVSADVDSAFVGTALTCPTCGGVAQVGELDPFTAEVVQLFQAPKRRANFRVLQGGAS